MITKNFGVRIFPPTTPSTDINWGKIVNFSLKANRGMLMRVLEMGPKVEENRLKSIN